MADTVVFLPDEHTRKHFLRGIGFSDSIIGSLSSLLTNPIQYASSGSHAISQRTHEQCNNTQVPECDDREHFANQMRCIFTYCETLIMFYQLPHHDQGFTKRLYNDIMRKDPVYETLIQ